MYEYSYNGKRLENTRVRLPLKIKFSVVDIRECF